MGRAGRVNVKRKEVEITSSQSSAAAQTHGCARENQKLRQNVLDGADFVRDVLDSYLVTSHFPIRRNLRLRMRGNHRGANAAQLSSENPPNRAFPAVEV